MLRKANKAPAVPLECRTCAVRDKGICGAFQDSELDVLEGLKTGDRILPAGSKLYGEGERCTELFTVLDGWVTLFDISESGRRQILDFALPGSFLGYQPEPADPMLHGAECLTDVAICVLPRRQFVRLMEARPALAARLAWLNWRDMVAARDQLTNLGSRKAQAKIANLLVRLCTRASGWIHSGGERECALPLTQSHIADALGLTSVHVCQTLRQLRDKGVLSFKNGQLRIHDPVALAQIAEVEDFLAA